MRRALALVGILVVAAIAAGMLLRGGEAPTTATVVHAGTIQAGISLLDVVDKDPGTLQGLPINVTVVRLGTPPQLVDALIKGDVDLAVLPVELAAVAINKGADAYIIAIDYDMNQAIIARSDSGIKTPEDLRGRKVAAVVGSGTYAMFKALMKEVYGLDVGVGEGYDVEIVNLAPPQVVDALANGDVDAAVIWEPLVSLAVEKHNAVIVATLADLWRQYIGDSEAPAPMLAWVATGKIVSDKTLLSAVLEAHYRAAEKWVSQRDWTVSILVDLYNLPPDVAESVYDRSVVHTEKCIPDEYKQLIDKIWTLAVEAGYIDSKPSLDRVVTCSNVQGS